MRCYPRVGVAIIRSTARDVAGRQAIQAEHGCLQVEESPPVASRENRAVRYTSETGALRHPLLRKGRSRGGDLWADHPKREWLSVEEDTGVVRNATCRGVYFRCYPELFPCLSEGRPIDWGIPR